MYLAQGNPLFFPEFRARRFKSCLVFAAVFPNGVGAWAGLASSLKLVQLFDGALRLMAISIYQKQTLVKTNGTAMSI